MNAREIKALQLVAGGRITRGNGYWLVPSQDGALRHRVVIDGLFPSCTCDDWELRSCNSAAPEPCKHILAVQEWVARLVGEEHAPPPVDPATVPPTPKKKTYKQPWREYNLAQTREKGHVLAMLADLVNGLRPKEPVKRGRGRPEIPLADNVFAAVYKTYVGWSARRFMCDLQTAYEAGHLSRSMSHNSVLRALENPDLTPVLKDLIGQTALPLAAVETTFAVDSSGFTTTGKLDRWFDTKYGIERTRQVWAKVHLCTACLSNVVTAADILDQHANDSPQLPGLIDATAEGFKIGTVCADKAYPASTNFEAVAKHGGTLFAAFKPNTTGSVGGLFAKMFHFFQFNREEYLRKYHARSNVESTFSGIKRVLGDTIRSKTDVAMKNEVYAKLVAWNLTCLVHAIYEMGVAPVFWQPPEPPNQPRDIIRFPTRA
jgi:hypothetical protein